MLKKKRKVKRPAKISKSNVMQSKRKKSLKERREAIIRAQSILKAEAEGKKIKPKAKDEPCVEVLRKRLEKEKADLPITISLLLGACVLTFIGFVIIVTQIKDLTHGTGVQPKTSISSEGKIEADFYDLANLHSEERN